MSVVPFMLITPLGQLVLTDLLVCLQQSAVNYRRLNWLADWSRRATRIYLKKRFDSSAVARACAYELAWREKFLYDRAIICELQSFDDYTRLLEAKRELRSRFPTWVAQVSLDKLDYTTRLHAFHVPDEEDWLDEAHLLKCGFDKSR
jgi:hypothetical protein